MYPNTIITISSRINNYNFYSIRSVIYSICSGEKIINRKKRKPKPYILL